MSFASQNQLGVSVIGFPLPEHSVWISSSTHTEQHRFFWNNSYFHFLVFINHVRSPSVIPVNSSSFEMTEDCYLQHVLTAGSWRPSSSRFIGSSFITGAGVGGSSTLNTFRRTILKSPKLRWHTSLWTFLWKMGSGNTYALSLVRSDSRASCHGECVVDTVLGCWAEAGELIAGQITSLPGVSRKPGKGALEAPA